MTGETEHSYFPFPKVVVVPDCFIAQGCVKYFMTLDLVSFFFGIFNLIMMLFLSDPVESVRDTNP